MDGEYVLTQNIFQLNCNRQLNIIGNKENTILKVGELFANAPGGSTNYSVNIYRLVWNAVSNATNAIFLYTNLSLNNVAFKFNFQVANISYFIAAGRYEFINCTMPTLVYYNLRNVGAGIYLTNCYGGYACSGYGVNVDWNYQTNYITDNPQVDENYKIIEDESLWKHIGTGTNPDGSQANLGVYGGEYSWEK